MNRSLIALAAVSTAALLSSCVVDQGGFPGSGPSEPQPYYRPGPSPYSGSYSGTYSNSSGYYSRPPGYHDRYDHHDHYNEQPHGHYSQGQGYSNYRPEPRPQYSGGSNSSSQKSPAYNQGFRMGGDDYRAKRSKHMDRYSKLFNNETHDAFRDGYDAGYDSARRHDR